MKQMESLSDLAEINAVLKGLKIKSLYQTLFKKFILQQIS